MKKTKSLKALVLSLGLAALMVPATLNAQINRGLLENPYKQDDSHKHNGMLNSQPRSGETSFTVNTQDFGQDVPLGSGIAILIGAGLGYVALKKKEDEQ